MKRWAALILSLFLLVTAGVHSTWAQAEGHDEPKQTVTVNGTQAWSKGSADYFIGQVLVERLFTATEYRPVSGAYVSFEPGARSNWHIHPLGQTLVVTSGLGLTQAWGGPIVEIKAGDVVQCPPGIKHWHGAGPNSAMTHLALSGVLEGKSVEWLEPVTSEQYGQYKNNTQPAN